MVRRAVEPLEKRDVNLFKGDWEELQLILAPTAISPSEFIRRLVRQKIKQIRGRQTNVSTE